MRFLQVLLGLLAASCRHAAQSGLSIQDRLYLTDLAKDTWRCIASLADTPSGFPFDNSDHGEFTSVSNIGFYLTSVAAAKDLGFIDEPEEHRRLSKTIGSLEKLRTWHGFQQCWNSVVSLQPSPNDTWVSLVDSGNLAAGLLTVAAAVPSLAVRCEKLFKTMDWGYFYDNKQHALIGGFNTKTSQVNPQWRLDMLATDALLAQFFSVATGGAPTDLWSHLDHATETTNGMSYFRPGWQAGGLFMQFISGIWLDTRKSKIGMSAKNFADAQILHAASIHSPVWGWSASDDPNGGYLGWGHIQDDVVTPHACVLAIDYFPEDAARNLHELEEMGGRSPDQGFYDALNVKSGKVANKFLILDQGMLFLSLANFLRGNIIRRWFQSDPIISKGWKSADF